MPPTQNEIKSSNHAIASISNTLYRTYWAIGENGSILLPHCPPLDGYNQDNPCHQECNEAHGNRENEPRIEIIVFHCHNYVAGLQFISIYPSEKYSQLTLDMNMSPPAIKQKAVINSVGGLPGKIDVGGDK